VADEEAATSERTAYYFAGLHADTLYQDDKCIPIGPGEVVSLSEEDVNNEANAHLFESGALAVMPEPAEPEPEEEEPAPTTSKSKASSTKK
jgi:hypothetical protein